MSTSTNNTGNPASGAWSTASARTPARLPRLVGRLSGTSVDQEPIQPIPGVSSPSLGAGACSVAVGVGAGCWRGTGLVAVAGVRVMAITVSLTAIACGAPERAAPRAVPPIPDRPVQDFGSGVQSERRQVPELLAVQGAALGDGKTVPGQIQGRVPERLVVL
ncbi:hypothetical protein ACFWA5_48660 [Streptomyces mirabilis]|uniref:hypothetical protein n=1 Tax=Streptomyces mirabilis TaxID=68239 RepID=UPI00365C7877